MSQYASWMVARVPLKGMAACAIAALFVASSCLIPLPARVHAQYMPGKVCTPLKGVVGCYYCQGNPSPGTPSAGCSNGQAQGRWQFGTCENDNQGNDCISWTQDCGTNFTCEPIPKKVGLCSNSMPICRNPPE